MTEAQGNILIVDDDSNIRRVLCTTLGELGFTMEEACMAKERSRLLKLSPSTLLCLISTCPALEGWRHARN